VLIVEHTDAHSVSGDLGLGLQRRGFGYSLDPWPHSKRFLPERLTPIHCGIACPAAGHRPFQHVAATWQADADADADRLRPKLEWLHHCSDQPLRDQSCPFAIPNLRQQNGELVAAGARQCVAVANSALQSLSHEPQSRIASVMTIGVVHQLEPVEICHEQGERCDLLPRR
jgi:hypothetical protein